RRLELLGVDLDGALEELRALAHGIYPRTLSEFGVAEALRGVVTGASVAVRVTDHGFGRHAPAVENAVYFVCLEAVQNATKHAGCGAIDVELGRRADAAWFAVSDDGDGFDPGGAPAGAGLVNMSDRVTAFGGALTIDSAPGRGCRIGGSIPLDG
ncbi:MAG TPA: ATP-binding protein, partial [Solirubrobacteraceae bacterium]|nr:ATP-binding protein [Solirubrobacteraceae bacterium]